MRLVDIKHETCMLSLMGSWGPSTGVDAANHCTEGVRPGLQCQGVGQQALTGRDDHRGGHSALQQHHNILDHMIETTMALQQQHMIETTMALQQQHMIWTI
jgi:hypothetical protein